MKEKRLKAGFTIEMSVIVPIVVFIFLGIILSMFYFHDKNILNGAAYETVVVSSMKMREKEAFTVEEIEAFCRERIKGKCIFLTFTNMNVSIEDEEIQVRLTARKKGFRLSVEKKMKVTEPEKKIRDIRRLDIKNGEKNND